MVATGDAGSTPAIAIEILTKPTIPEVAPLIRAYYRKAGNAVGGSLHLIFEDGNVHDNHIRRALEKARGRGDVDGMVIADKLLRMSRTQRAKLARMNWYPD